MKGTEGVGGGGGVVLDWLRWGGLSDVADRGGECADIGEEGGDADASCHHDDGVVLGEALEGGAVGAINVELT